MRLGPLDTRHSCDERWDDIPGCVVDVDIRHHAEDRRSIRVDGQHTSPGTLRAERELRNRVCGTQLTQEQDGITRFHGDLGTTNVLACKTLAEQDDVWPEWAATALASWRHFTFFFPVTQMA
jgi:hypothetical protein